MLTLFVLHRPSKEKERGASKSTSWKEPQIECARLRRRQESAEQNTECEARKLSKQSWSGKGMDDLDMSF